MSDELWVPDRENSLRLPNRKYVARRFVAGADGILMERYYKLVWTLQEHGLGVPTTYDVDLMIKAGIQPGAEGTQTLVLFPDGEGRLTERACTYNTKHDGRRLAGYNDPVVCHEFVVGWNAQKDELDHLKIDPKRVRPYTELGEAVRNMLNGQMGYLYVSGWERGLPISFSAVPDKRFYGARVCVDPRHYRDHGERPLSRGNDDGSLDTRNRAFNTFVYWSPDARRWPMRPVKS